MVHGGARALVTIPSLDNRQFEGKVEAVGYSADSVSRTFTTKIAIPNPAHVLRAGMISESRVYDSTMIDVLAVPSRGHLDHLGRAVDRGDRSRRQPLADQRDRDAVAAADLEQAVGRADLQSVDRPDKPLRCRARHAPSIASRAREAQLIAWGVAIVRRRDC